MAFQIVTALQCSVLCISQNLLACNTLLSSLVGSNLFSANTHSQSHVCPLTAGPIIDVWPLSAVVDETSRISNLLSARSARSWFQQSSEPGISFCLNLPRPTIVDLLHSEVSDSCRQLPGTIYNGLASLANKFLPGRQQKPSRQQRSPARSMSEGEQCQCGRMHVYLYHKPPAMCCVLLTCLLLCYDYV